MKQEFYLGMPYVDLALVAFAIFVGVFLAALLWLFSRRRAELDTLAALPLEDHAPRETTP